MTIDVVHVAMRWCGNIGQCGAEASLSTPASQMGSRNSKSRLAVAAIRCVPAEAAVRRQKRRGRDRPASARARQALA